jgi:LPPG:FO 2-phospho-L-lactate transferase
MTSRVVALSGGVGGAKLVDGLARVLAPDDLTVIINTGDDFRHLGLWISPDIDSVVYALAGLSDPVKGWGRRDESWNFMQAIRGLGGQDWFLLGDSDLAMHVQRTHSLSEGSSLTEVTGEISRILGIRARLLPMSDDPIATRLQTDEGWLNFQDYFVRRRCAPVIRGIRFDGAATARAQPEALEALADPQLRLVVICPSNPFLSVEPILAIPAIRAALIRCAAPVVAVTPIIGGRAVKGPTAKIMEELGLEISGAAVARRYAGLIDAFVVDQSDPEPVPIDGVQFIKAQTRMDRTQDREELARAVLAIAEHGKKDETL